ncbi:MAG: ABC transporter ATP-binding protein [Pseudobdellovibrionaceae bacterium]|jgi:ATP-binding cassette subfamily B multidrug efflux pump|nr:ABC transporter ATP-binding protein [Pseudobdellovibrionaceae bacterium]
MLNMIIPGLDLIDRKLPQGAKLPVGLWSFVWYFVRQVKWPAISVFLLCIVANILLSFEPWLFGKIAEALKDYVVDQPDGNLAFYIVAYIVMVQIGCRVFFAMSVWIDSIYLMPFVMMVRRQLAQYMYGHSSRYFQDDYVGRLAGKVMEMPDSIRTILMNFCHNFNYCLMQIVMAFVFFVLLDPLYGLVLGGYMIGCGAIIFCSVKYIGPASYAAVEDMNLVRGRYIDSISNMFLVKVFARSKQEDLLLRESLYQAGSSAQYSQQQVFRWQALSQHVANAIFQSGLLFLVIYQFKNGDIELSSVVMVLTFGVVISGNSWWLADLFVTFIQLLATVRNGIDTIVQTFEVVDKPDAQVLKMASANIEISDLSFSYPERPVFNGLSLNINAGEKVGLVGPSGAGKSSLVQLILRLYDVGDGEIRISGENIADVTQDSLRSAIAVIPQTSELLHRSILENIRFGSEESSLEDVIHAAKLAHAHDFILGLVDKDGRSGYDAEVGERGVKLSGGQRQRIALARAILKDAPILILDEATSALDSESEKLIEESLSSIMEGRTVLAIAHRLSTLQSMDRLIVMEQGRIVETGTHAELLALNGLYARLWSLQTSGFIK